MKTKDYVAIAIIMAVAIGITYWLTSTRNKMEKESNLHTKIISKKEMYKFYVGLGGDKLGDVIHGNVMDEIILDSPEASKSDPSDIVLTRDSVYSMKIYGFKSKDSAGKRVQVFKDSARRIPIIDTTYFNLDKKLIAHELDADAKKVYEYIKVSRQN